MRVDSGRSGRNNKGGKRYLPVSISFSEPDHSLESMGRSQTQPPPYPDDDPALHSPAGLPREDLDGGAEERDGPGKDDEEADDRSRE